MFFKRSATGSLVSDPFFEKFVLIANDVILMSFQYMRIAKEVWERGWRGKKLKLFG